MGKDSKSSVEASKPSWKVVSPSKRVNNLISFYTPSKGENKRISVMPLLEVTMLGANKWEGWLMVYFLDSKLSYSYVKSYFEANKIN